MFSQRSLGCLRHVYVTEVAIRDDGVADYEHALLRHNSRTKRSIRFVVHDSLPCIEGVIHLPSVPSNVMVSDVQHEHSSILVGAVFAREPKRD